MKHCLVWDWRKEDKRIDMLEKVLQGVMEKEDWTIVSRGHHLAAAGEKQVRERDKEADVRRFGGLLDRGRLREGVSAIGCEILCVKSKDDAARQGRGPACNLAVSAATGVPTLRCQHELEGWMERDSRQAESGG